jgi:hypothetical protein
MLTRAIKMGDVQHSLSFFHKQKVVPHRHHFFQFGLIKNFLNPTLEYRIGMVS